MSLLDHAIWWHVYPLGATGAPIRHRSGDDSGHRLARLENWLDYAVQLGCSGMLLGPIFESDAHGYDTLDYFKLDRRLGDDADFDHFMDACRARGLSVMLDGVFNHVSVKHPMVEAALRGEGMIKTVDGYPYLFEGNPDLAEFDHSDPRVADLVVDVMLHWLRRGIAGWRLDAAYRVPTEFWAEVTTRVRAEFPDAVFLGEVIHGEYDEIAASGHLDSITQYELWKAIWSSIQTKNFWELAHGLERHQAFSESLVLNTFVGNHDVDRVASLAGPDGAALAALILFTLPGMPSVYYGDEQGFSGTKVGGVEADDPIRPPLPETPDQLLPYGAWMHRLYTDAIGLRRRNPWLVRGRLDVVSKTNTEIIYAVTGEGHRCDVHAWLEPEARIQIAMDGQPSYGWSASSPR